MIVIYQFVKWPEPGSVKTRLAAGVGYEPACEFYKWLALRCFSNISRKVGIVRVIYYSGAEERKFREWLPGAEAYTKQPLVPFGERITHAFQTGFESRITKKVIAVGTDCPHLNSDAIIKLADALDHHDVGIIPANDGGYAAIGLKAFTPIVFDNIEWSTSQVAAQTEERCKDSDLSFWKGDKLIDIDTIDDWEHVKKDFPEAPELVRI